MFDFNYFDTYGENLLEIGPSTSTTSFFPETVEDIMSCMKNLKERMEKDYKDITIYIWKGISFLPLPEYPELHYSELLREDTAYILAGTGIVCGKKCYDLLKKCNLILEWSDKYIPLEDQSWYNILSEAGVVVE